jgi:hypothetical protein
MGVEWIDYKGKKILYCNLQGLKKDVEIMQVIERQMQEIGQATSPILLLLNIEDSPMTADSVQFAKEKLSKYNTKLKKIALVGITGLKTIIVKGFEKSRGGVPEETFATEEEAKAWLVS